MWVNFSGDHFLHIIARTVQRPTYALGFLVVTLALCMVLLFLTIMHVWFDSKLLTKRSLPWLSGNIAVVKNLISGINTDCKRSIFSLCNVGAVLLNNVNELALGTISETSSTLIPGSDMKYCTQQRSLHAVIVHPFMMDNWHYHHVDVTWHCARWHVMSVFQRNSVLEMFDLKVEEVVRERFCPVGSTAARWLTYETCLDDNKHVGLYVSVHTVTQDGGLSTSFILSQAYTRYIFPNRIYLIL